MARTTFTILALALLCASAFAQDQPADKVSPAANAAAGAIGGALAPAVTALTVGIVPADTAAGRDITAKSLHECHEIKHALWIFSCGKHAQQLLVMLSLLLLLLQPILDSRHAMTVPLRKLAH